MRVLLRKRPKHEGDGDYWKRMFLKWASAHLTKRQKELLFYIYANCKEEKTLTSLARELSEKLEMPLSTVKWNLRALRNYELLEAGDKDSKNKPCRLTRAGEELARSLFGT